MRFTKKLTAGLAVMLLLGAGSVSASDLNEVGALLVFPAIAAFGQGAPAGETETYVTITNTGGGNVVAHGSYINGDPTPIFLGGAGYCYECNFSIPLTGADTETLVIRTTPTGVSIESEDGTVSRNCDHPVGMLVVSLEATGGGTITDNILFGEQVLVNYGLGYAFSIPAIPFQGMTGNGDRRFGFDDVEYKGFPRRVAADFLAPNHPLSGLPLFVAEMVLFTLNFDTQNPPNSDCSINGFDAAENNFSNSVQFGCWTFESLCDLDPEFCFPNLGQVASLFPDTHGWLSLDCNVDGADGGVHGAIVQVASPGTQIRRNDPLAPLVNGWAAWGRLLYQSATSGDATTLIANPAPAPPGGF